MNPQLMTAAIRELDLAGVPTLVLVDAAALLSEHVPPFPPDQPAVVVGIDSAEAARAVQLVLLAAYPEDHALRLLNGSAKVQTTVAALPGETGIFEGSCLHIPPLKEGSSLESFAEIVAQLRAPDGCPWDRQQTHESLRPHLLEECYEALAAIDSGDSVSLREELGDLLLQILLHAQIASEGKRFTISDVISGIYDKIIRRHPHVFGELRLEGVDGVLQNWERLKEHERAERKSAAGLLDGVPVTLPALAQSQEYQDRAARVGFDWPEIGGVLDKIREEIEEIREAASATQIAAELGDLLFVLVNLARWKGADAESVLREANARFKRRFGDIERAARQQDRRISDLSFQEMDALWRASKASENGGA